MNHRNVPIPRKLYRYRPLPSDPSSERWAQELDAIDNSYLWFSKFSDLNDPMESFQLAVEPSHPLEKQVLTAIGLPYERLQRWAEANANHFINKENWGICCFAETNSNRAMWAYYANNFRGMCIEYDTQALLRATHLSRRLIPVDYRDSPPQLTIPAISSNFEQFLESTVSTKHSDWSHEKEWRYVIPDSGKVEIPDDAITRVFFGPRAPSTAIEEVSEASHARIYTVHTGQTDHFDFAFSKVEASKSALRTFGAKSDYQDLSADIERLEVQYSLDRHSLLNAIEITRQHPNCGCVSIVGIDEDRPERLYVWVVGEYPSGIEHTIGFEFQINNGVVEPTPVVPNRMRS